MKNRDYSSIAYLFREMDPSEEVEFERSLDENENLLIEVETFRKIKDRLGDLPYLEPPKEVSDSVMRLAEQKSAKKSITWQKPIFYAAAAVLLAGFSAVALISEPDITSPYVESDRASAGINSTFYFPSAASPVQLTSQTAVNKITPWVDNNEMLRFSDRTEQNQAATLDSILKSSYQKLTPVSETDPYLGMQRRLHLTGSQP